MIYDIIIVGGGASGLFFSVHSDKKYKKLILEKTGKLGTKLLLAGGGRCNFTNENIDINSDYFGKNIKSLHSIFHKFSNQDMIDFLYENGVSSHVEERGRLILDSEKSSQLVDLLKDLSIKNNTNIYYDHEIVSVIKKDNIFIVKTNQGEYKSKKVVVASGGKSFANTGTTGIGYKIAEDFGLKINNLYHALGGVVLVEKFESLMGSSIAKANIDLYYKSKLVDSFIGPLLFTHRGLSGPTIFDILLVIGDYINNKIMDKDVLSNNNFYKDFKLKISVSSLELTKRLKQFFDIRDDSNLELEVNVDSPKGRDQSTVTGGGVLLGELTQNFEFKNDLGLYFIGEVCDITGRTGGYNLQWCWSSAYVCAKNI